MRWISILWFRQGLSAVGKIRGGRGTPNPYRVAASNAITPRFQGLIARTADIHQCGCACLNGGLKSHCGHRPSEAKGS